MYFSSSSIYGSAKKMQTNKCIISCINNRDALRHMFVREMTPSSEQYNESIYSCNVQPSL